ncbi:MAG: hypothetical protein ABIW46_09505 [Acidimicrobiales bacterium]
MDNPVPRKRRPLIGLALVLALLAAGCGGDDDPEVAGGSSSSTPAATPGDGGDTCQLTPEEVREILGTAMEPVQPGGCSYQSQDFTGTGPSNVLLTTAAFDGSDGMRRSIRDSLPAVEDVDGVGDEAFSSGGPDDAGVTTLVVIDGDTQYILVLGSDAPRAEAVDSLKALYQASRS